MSIHRCVLTTLFVASVMVSPTLGSVQGSASADSGTATANAVSQPLRYTAPVRAPVVDPFRMPNGPFGAGNRGLEYGTVGGEPVFAPASGIIAFVGPVGGRLVLTIRHPDGLLSSLTGLSSTTWSTGQVVLGGDHVGTAAEGLHFGIRLNGEYLDPAVLLRNSGTRRRLPARLVPAEPKAARRQRFRVQASG